MVLRQYPVTIERELLSTSSYVLRVDISFKLPKTILNILFSTQEEGYLMLPKPTLIFYFSVASTSSLHPGTSGHQVSSGHTGGIFRVGVGVYKLDYTTVC